MTIATAPLPMSQLRPARPLPVPPPVLPATQLFKGGREVVIDFAGMQYRLRITRKNKLILQK